jgi:hypothetical protein
MEHRMVQLFFSVDVTQYSQSFLLLLWFTFLLPFVSDTTHVQTDGSFSLSQSVWNCCYIAVILKHFKNL